MLPPPDPNQPSAALADGVSWWRQKWLKLPVWGWIIVGFLGVGAIGSALGAPEEQADAVPPSAAEATDEPTTQPTTAPTAAETVPPTPTTVETVAAPTTVPEPSTTQPSTTQPSTTQPSITAAPTELNVFGGNDPEDFLMPMVVCMNLQEAQNEIQDHGVFFSRSEDATGEGRMQVLDSNWQVVAQSPDAGTPISEGDALLYVVKLGELPNPCG